MTVEHALQHAGDLQRLDPANRRAAADLRGGVF